MTGRKDLWEKKIWGKDKGEEGKDKGEEEEAMEDNNVELEDLALEDAGTFTRNV